jgi:nucleotide-binding universal stress UspA family protein
MEITTITVPLAIDVTTGDKLSIPSRTALAVAEQLARDAGVALRLVSASTSNNIDRVAGILEGLADGCGIPGTITRTLPLNDSGDTEGTLLTELFAEPDSLWCVGSHGRTAIGEMVFGSVSADLVRDAGVPMVVAGPYARPRPEASVMAVALDGTEHGETIIPAATDLARLMGKRLRMLEVGRPHPGKGDDTFDSNYLARLAERLPDPGHADYDVLYGDADHALERYAEDEHDIALLAMATHGVPAGARLSVPSIALRVVRKSKVPVLLYHHLADLGVDQE